MFTDFWQVWQILSGNGGYFDWGLTIFDNFNHFLLFYQIFDWFRAFYQFVATICYFNQFLTDFRRACVLSFDNFRQILLGARGVFWLMVDNIWHIWQLFCNFIKFLRQYLTHSTTFCYFIKFFTSFGRSINLWPLFAIFFSFLLIFGENVDWVSTIFDKFC